MAYPYRVTLQAGEPQPSLGDGTMLVIDVTNHDELFGLVDRVAALGVLPQGEVAEFTIGLKLFSEIMLRHRGEPLFQDLFPHFRTFMKRLKSSGTTGTGEAAASSPVMVS